MLFCQLCNLLAYISSGKYLNFYFIGENILSKKIIVRLFIVGIVLVALGIAINGAGMAASTKGVIFSGAALSAVGLIVGLVSWIGALVAIGKQGRWGWFILVLLLSWIGELIYLIGGPTLG
jgi:hypothetical protein